jgi:hypothetical protein
LRKIPDRQRALDEGRVIRIGAIFETYHTHAYAIEALAMYQTAGEDAEIVKNQSPSASFYLLE